MKTLQHIQKSLRKVNPVPKLFSKGHIRDPRKLPHQAEVSNFFSIKQIGEHHSLSFMGTLEKKYILTKQRYTSLSKKSPLFSYAVMSAFLVIGITMFDTGGNLFKASLTDTATTFDGTVYPFEKSPNWFVTGGTNDRLFSSYSASELIPAPRYDIKTMQKDDWAKDVVNPKITYSIVYMGQYKYNHIEKKGSHPGVDIKLPKGTPILSIANGVVIKALDKTTGYGKHVVIKHTGVPEYGTLYSSYSHMSKLEVQVGQIVNKGEKIGEVGSTGSSTTSHIHFQVDTKDAPFHPYWPFAWDEVKKAGVSYTEAVNIGLGKENGLKYTINPFTFIHNYEKGYGNKTASTIPKATEEKLHSAAPKKEKTTETTTPTTTKNKTTIEKKPVIPEGKDVITAFDLIASPNRILEGDSTEIKIIALNEKGGRIQDFNEVVELTYKDGDDNKSISIKLKKGLSTTSIPLLNKGRVNFRVKFDTVFTSESVVVKKRATVSDETSSTGKAENFDTFKISGEKAVRIGESIVLTVRALDKNENSIASENFPAKGAYAISMKNLVVSPTKIVKGDFSTGEFAFRVKGKTRGAGWVKIGDTKYEITILPELTSQDTLDTKNTEITNTPTGTKIFSDVYSSHKHAEAITYLKEKNIINGYADGSFQPNKTVSRSEAIKMIFSAFNIPENNAIDSPFSDVKSNDWFSPFILAAYNLEIVNGYDNGTFKPENKVNRSEYFKIFLNSADIVLPTEASSSPFSDTEKSAWFAPYAEFAKEEKLLDFGNNFFPTQEITRAEVAETIYRFLK